MLAIASDFILWLTLALCLVQMAGFWGERRFSGAAATTLFLAITFCFAALIYSFATSDFSLKVVYENSHRAKPFLYKISGTWGNHEGSLLMLVWVLVLYGFLYSRSRFNSSALAVQGLICLLFIAFMKFTSNPFELLPVTPPAGRGLNPLLQDFGLAVHPPMLYLGYVGFSMVFSITVGYLLSGNIDKNFAHTARIWCMLAWSFLTLGIGLGSWWAYRELGWGGFWFWDPVENASLMPWLSGTALLHSLIITEKKRKLKRWTMLLAIITFGLSLAGFFLVRSGVLNSVHSFANDPERGVMILGIMAILMTLGFVAYALRAHNLKTTSEFNLLSRETGILFNNLLLTVLCVTVFTGTIYPLILSSLGGDTISVGTPFYTALFIPGALAIVYLCAVATLAKWKDNNFHQLLKRLAAPAGIPVIISGFAYFFSSYSEVEAFILFGGIYLLFAVIWEFKHKRYFENLPMIIAHGGLAVLVIGILLSASFTQKIEVMAKVGDKFQLAEFDITLRDVEEGFRDNFAYRKGVFAITKNNIRRATLNPEMRVYPIEQSTTTEASIFQHNYISDLYIIIGEKNKSGLYAVRAYYKPFISLIWAGCIIMFTGGMLRALLQQIRSHRITKRELAALTKHIN